MRTYRLYFVEIRRPLGWWRIGQTDDREQAAEWKKRYEDRGDEVRVITKSY